MIDQIATVRQNDASAESFNGRVFNDARERKMPAIGAASHYRSTILLKRDHPLGRATPLSRGADSGAEKRQHGEFMAVLSHELRNSLSGISNAARVLRMDMSAAPASIKARMLIERQVEQMSRLVADLMDMSQIRSGQLRLECEHIDLRVLLAQSIQTVELSLQQRSHRMTTSLPDEPIWLQADATRLEQIFVNLLVNAAKYTAAGGDIGLSLERGDDMAVVRIRDTGIGISADVLPKVFDMFVQADPSSRRAVAGLGIGLALVRSLVESHGGSVCAASAGLGQGSEFTVRLPMLRE